MEEEDTDQEEAEALMEDVAVVDLEVDAAEGVDSQVGLTVSNPKTRFMSPASPVTSPKTTLPNTLAPSGSSRLTGRPEGRRFGSTKITQPENKKEKPLSHTMTVQQLRAPFLGSTVKTSTEAPSKFRWP